VKEVEGKSEGSRGKKVTEATENAGKGKKEGREGGREEGKEDSEVKESARQWKKDA
jgi:hypothetical protein